MTRPVPITTYEDLTALEDRRRTSALSLWVQVAKPRAVACYGYGRPPEAVRKAAGALGDAGIVHLVQKRSIAGEWLYLAIKAGSTA